MPTVYLTPSGTLIYHCNVDHHHCCQHPYNQYQCNNCRTNKCSVTSAKLQRAPTPQPPLHCAPRSPRPTARRIRHSHRHYFYFDDDIGLVKNVKPTGYFISFLFHVQQSCSAMQSIVSPLRCIPSATSFSQCHQLVEAVSEMKSLLCPTTMALAADGHDNGVRYSG